MVSLLEQAVVISLSSNKFHSRYYPHLHYMIAGFFYWISDVQVYEDGGWNYIDELHKFVDGGMKGDAFINAVSGIVNRVCYLP